MLEAAVHHYHPDLVVLDGIRDLVADINDGVIAQDCIERLMHLASEERSCIVSILHQNKSAEDRNLRGWIGTELRNKAVEYYQDDLRTKLSMESSIMTDHVLDEQIEKAVTDGIILRSVSPLIGKKFSIPSRSSSVFTFISR